MTTTMIKMSTMTIIQQQRRRRWQCRWRRHAETLILALLPKSSWISMWWSIELGCLGVFIQCPQMCDVCALIWSMLNRVSCNHPVPWYSRAAWNWIGCLFLVHEMCDLIEKLLECKISKAWFKFLGLTDETQIPLELVLHIPPERPSLLDLLAVRFRINFWLDGWGSISPLRDWANSLECSRSPSLRLIILGITVSPGVTHSDSSIVFVMGTVVKHQPTKEKFRLRQRFTTEQRLIKLWKWKIWLDGQLCLLMNYWKVNLLTYTMKFKLFLSATPTNLKCARQKHQKSHGNFPAHREM